MFLIFGKQLLTIENEYRILPLKYLKVSTIIV